MKFKISKIKKINWNKSRPKFPGIPDLTILEPPEKRKPEKNIHIDKEQIKIGIIADIHQNTLFLSEILKIFQELEVNVVMAGGDYSYIPQYFGKEDPSNIRFYQFRKSMKIFEKWLTDSDRDDTHLALVMGNHECEDKYFKGGYSSSSYRQIREYTEILSQNTSITMPENPFESYDISNSLHLYVRFQEHQRTFRLTHAISDSFVTALYRGLYPENTNRYREAQLNELKELIGEVWLNSLEKNFYEAEHLWAKFVSSSILNKGEIASLITNNIINAMTFIKQLEYLSKSRHEYSKSAKDYLRNMQNYKPLSGRARDLSKDFLWDFYNPYDYGDQGVDFKADVYRMHRALGMGRMYSICGHFHADLGVFQASEEFGTHVIGVAGSQPHKRISSEMTAYLMECDEKGSDTIYRLSALDNYTNEFDCDLSKNEWA